MIEKSEVTVYELLYDLIFAYTISRPAVVLVAQSHKMFALKNVVEFLMLTLILWTIWTYQTVFANRFYENDRSSPLFLLFDLFWVAVLSQSINENFQLTYTTFAGVTSILFLSIAFQYYLKMRKVADDETRISCNQLSAILGISSVIGFVTIFSWGSFLLRFGLYAVSILVLASFPFIMRQTLQKFPTNFRHLLERCGLLTLLIVAQGIITIAGTITYNKISFESILFFILVIVLFLFYHTGYKSGMESDKASAGLVLIHSHYFIFAGLGLSVVTWANYIQGTVQTQTCVLLIGAALFAFLGGTMLNIFVYSTPFYNKQSFIWQSITFYIVWLVFGFFIWEIVLLYLGVTILLVLFLLYKLQRGLGETKSITK